MKTSNNDIRYMLLAKEAAEYSTCNKKHLGVCLVLEDGQKYKYMQGFNGPPSPLSKCNPCPRLNSHGGTDLHLCRAVHAERAALLICAKLGLSTKNSTLYSYMNIPCSNCLLELCKAGVKEIVCLNEIYYDELSKQILKEMISKNSMSVRYIQI